MIGLILAVGFLTQAVYAKKKPKEIVMWVNHFALESGDPTVTTTSSDSTTSGVGGGLTGLVVTSSTIGDTDSFGGNKVVHMGVQVPPENTVKGVRLCYEYSAGSVSFFTQTRLAQVQNPPAIAFVLMDDGTDLTAIGPVCVNSAVTTIDPGKGPLLLSFRIFTGATGDKLVIRGVGLLLQEREE